MLNVSVDLNPGNALSEMIINIGASRCIAQTVDDGGGFGLPFITGIKGIAGMSYATSTPPQRQHRISGGRDINRPSPHLPISIPAYTCRTCRQLLTKYSSTSRNHGAPTLYITRQGKYSLPSYPPSLFVHFHHCTARTHSKTSGLLYSLISISIFSGGWEFSDTGTSRPAPK